MMHDTAAESFTLHFCDNPECECVHVVLRNSVRGDFAEMTLTLAQCEALVAAAQSVRYRRAAMK